MTLVDERDIDIALSVTWRPFINQTSNTIYAHAARKYLHRLILNAPRGVQVDHVDGDGLNNTRANLRFASASQNGANRGPNKTRRPKSSRFKGVSLDKGSGLWTAQIKINKKCIHLGRYANEESAARAYDLKAQDSWGEFAYLNFPGEG